MIIYVIGLSYEKSGVYTFGIELARKFPEEVLLVLLDSTSSPPKLDSLLRFPIEISHCPTFIARAVIDYTTEWPSAISILPNNSACGYEIANILRGDFQKIGIATAIIGIIHSNARTSLDLVRDNLFMINKVYAVSNAILASIDESIRKSLTCKVLPCAISKHHAEVTGHCLMSTPQRLRVIYVGRLVEDQKRVSRLLQLVAVLRTCKIAFTLEVIGDGHLAAELARVARSHPSIEPDVILRGEQSHERVIEAMTTSDVIVLTSVFEGTPLVVMEAMSVGTVPVVMNYGPEVAELITDGVNGYVVDQGCVDDMAEILGMLANDRKRLQELSAQALERASKFVSFNTWRDEICRPLIACVKPEINCNSSYKETRGRIKRGVKRFKEIKKILIWGGGHLGRLLVDELILNDHPIDGCFIVDRVLCRYLSSYRGIPYYPPDKLPEEEIDMAIVASEYYAVEIQTSLESWKLERDSKFPITVLRDWT